MWLMHNIWVKRLWFLLYFMHLAVIFQQSLNIMRTLVSWHRTGSMRF